ncbi:hypothetical protein [Streptomonospora arabica]|uniref:Tyrosine-type recombinase/integrase n=1 Tax=Streptomonospora arabica TaxID=412417 RepID=A0ABV9SSD9_9ACTN
MAYAEKLVKSWRACWKGPDGKLLKLSGFDTKKSALDHANDQEADIRRRGSRANSRSHMSLEEWALDWYRALDLEPSTMERYLSWLQNHVIPRWGDWTLRDLQDADNDVARWVKDLEDAGYARNSINGIRWMLYTLCADAAARGHMSRNPAAVRRGRGRVAPKRKQRQQERAARGAIDPLTAFLIAERTAVMSGRGDEFTLTTAMFYTGVRWGEAIGLERSLLSAEALQIRWQLARHGSALQRRDPKDGSVRDVDLPPFLADLLARQARQVTHPAAVGEWCPCGEGEPKRYRHPPGIHVFAGVRGNPHWRRTGFGDQCFYPAARGVLYPTQQARRPVYVDAPPEGREIGIMDRSTRTYARPDLAVACWAPLAPGMVLHSLRHSHKTLMEELGVPSPLMDERMGHSDGSVQARYSHPTEGMRRRLVEGLQERWEATLASRARMEPHSPVGVVDGLLAPYRDCCSRSTPDESGCRRAPVRGIVA